MSRVEEVIPDSLMKQIRQRVRAARGHRGSFERTLDRAPDREPEEGDRL